MQYIIILNTFGRKTVYPNGQIHYNTISRRPCVMGSEKSRIVFRVRFHGAIDDVACVLPFVSGYRLCHDLVYSSERIQQHTTIRRYKRTWANDGPFEARNAHRDRRWASMGATGHRDTIDHYLNHFGSLKTVLCSLGQYN